MPEPALRVCREGQHRAGGIPVPPLPPTHHRPTAKEGQAVKRKRKTPLPVLFERAKTQFNAFIRELDQRCVQCGSTNELTAGHVLTAAFKSTKYDEMNTFGQCKGCNLKHEHHPELYHQWYINTFGLEAFDELVRKHWTITKYTRADLEGIIEKYAELRKQLKATPDRVRAACRTPFPSSVRRGRRSPARKRDAEKRGVQAGGSDNLNPKNPPQGVEGHP